MCSCSSMNSGRPKLGPTVGSDRNRSQAAPKGSWSPCLKFINFLLRSMIFEKGKNFLQNNSRKVGQLPSALLHSGCTTLLLPPSMKMEIISISRCPLEFQECGRRSKCSQSAECEHRGSLVAPLRKVSTAPRV